MQFKVIDIIARLVLIVILSILSLVFALCAFGKNFRRGQAISGLVLGGISLLICLLSIVILIILM